MRPPSWRSAEPSVCPNRQGGICIPYPLVFISINDMQRCVPGGCLPVCLSSRVHQRPGGPDRRGRVPGGDPPPRSRGNKGQHHGWGRHGGVDRECRCAHSPRNNFDLGSPFSPLFIPRLRHPWEQCQWPPMATNRKKNRPLVEWLPTAANEKNTMAITIRVYRCSNHTSF